MNTIKLSVLLKEAREAKGISQSELANIVGLSRSTLCRYESGQRTRIAFTTLFEIARVLEVNIPDLLSNEEYKHYLDQFLADQSKPASNDIAELQKNALAFVATDADFRNIVRIYEELTPSGKKEAAKQIKNLSYNPEYGKWANHKTSQVTHALDMESLCKVVDEDTARRREHLELSRKTQSKT